MNDEASSSAARQYGGHREEEEEAEPVPTAAELAERRKKSRQLFSRKRGERLDLLLADFDMLVYAELSIIYYMDCSFLRFLLRCFVQFLYLTPKAPILPEPPVDKPVIGPILGSNVLCLVLHIWLSAPSAGEATQGYLHGGLAMDFIGQQGPTSKFHLVLLDLLLLGLQLAMLPASLERRKLRDAATSTDAAAGTRTASSARASSRQDLDSEERGVRRSQEEEEGIEMQDLNSTAHHNNSPQAQDQSEQTTSEDRSSLLAQPRPQPANDTAIIDMFNAGQVTLINLDPWDTVKDQARLMRHPPPPSENPSRAEQRTLRAEIAGRMLRMRFGGGGLR